MTPPLKWHGGKHYLAKKIVALMPPHLHYVEPYSGGLSVLLTKDPEGISEVVNDIHTDLSRFWKVLQGRKSFKQFRRLCEMTPFSELEWNDAKLEFDEWPKHDPEVSDDVCRAWRFFVLCRQSLAGRMKSFAPLSRTRTRRGMNEQASAWINAVDGLSEVHTRLRRVVIFNREALEVVREQDGKDTLFYLDPPYLHKTRASTDVYTHEMTYRQHRDLLEILTDVKGRFLLSGYNNDLYRGYANTTPRWNRHDFDLPNNAAGGGNKRRMVESVWCNF